MLHGEYLFYNTVYYYFNNNRFYLIVSCDEQKPLGEKNRFLFYSSHINVLENVKQGATVSDSEI